MDGVYEMGNFIQYMDEAILLYSNGSSLNEIGKLYDVNSALVRYHLIKRGVVIRNLKDSVNKSIKTKDIVVNQTLHENLIGWVLGDGSIRIAKRGVTPFFNYTDKQYEHIIYIKQMLLDNNILSNITFNKYNSCYQLQSESLPFFMDYYNMFYGYEGLNTNNQKRKTLPDIDISPTILLNWYIGDGSIKIQNRLHTCQIACKYKNENILDQLRSLFGMVSCYEYNTATGFCYTYYFNHNAFVSMLNFIGDCPVDSYRYKWNLSH